MKEKKQLAGYRPYNSAPAQRVLNAGYEQVAAEIARKLVAGDHVHKGDAKCPDRKWGEDSIKRALLRDKGTAVLALMPFLQPNYYGF